MLPLKVAQEQGHIASDTKGQESGQLACPLTTLSLPNNSVKTKNKAGELWYRGKVPLLFSLAGSPDGFAPSRGRKAPPRRSRPLLPHQPAMGGDRMNRSNRETLP